MPPLADRDLQRRGPRDGQQGAGDAEQRRAEEDRDQHEERVQVDRPALDLGLDDRVLELLVDDRPDDPDDGVEREVGEERDDPDEDGGDGRADRAG